MKKTKLSALLLAVIILVAALASCSLDDAVSETADETTPVETTVADTEEDSFPPLTSGETLDPDNLPQFTELPFVEVNGNVPIFHDYEITEKEYKIFSGLDNLGREGFAQALVGPDMLPDSERESIGDIRPSGWPENMEDINYGGELIEGNYLYNRCHLLGFQYSGENDNRYNLITGTRFLNVQGMLPFETQITEYVERTNNHVLVRVTPIFVGDNLLASGVQMEALSVEDKGKEVSFNIYVFNVQPGIEIDYSTGASHLEGEAEQSTAPGTAVSETTIIETTVPATTTPVTEAPVTATPVPVTEAPQQSYNYVLNTNTRKFHYSWCGSVKQMKPKNTSYYNGTRDEIIAMGYSPCARCKP